MRPMTGFLNAPRVRKRVHVRRLRGPFMVLQAAKRQFLPDIDGPVPPTVVLHQNKVGGSAVAPLHERLEVLVNDVHILELAESPIGAL